MLFQPCAQATLIECVTTRQFTALLSSWADFFQANIAVSFFISLHWWQVLEEFFTDSLILRLLFFTTVSKDEHSWHASTHNALKHWERVITSAHVHVYVVCVVDVECWERLMLHPLITTIIARKYLHTRLTHAIAMRDRYWLSVSTRLCSIAAHWLCHELVHLTRDLSLWLLIEHVVMLLLWLNWLLLSYWCFCWRRISLNRLQFLHEIRATWAALDIVHLSNVDHSSELPITSVAEVSSECHSILVVCHCSLSEICVN